MIGDAWELSERYSKGCSHHEKQAFQNVEFIICDDGNRKRRSKFYTERQWEFGKVFIGKLVLLKDLHCDRIKGGPQAIHVLKYENDIFTSWNEGRGEYSLGKCDQKVINSKFILF